MNSINLLLTTLLSVYISSPVVGPNVVMMEVCHNGLDDDGDGLYDAFDTDCDCDNQRELSKSVPNGNLRQITGCCTIIRDEERGCVDDWYRLGGRRAGSVVSSLTYISGECNLVHQQVYIRNTNLGSDPMFHIITGEAPRDDYIPDYVGFCLRTPLKANKSYSLSVDQTFFQEQKPKDEHLLTFYGLHNCNDINNLEQDVNFCSAGFSYEELSVSDTTQLESLDSKTAIYNITSSQDIEAIVIGQKCNLESYPPFGVSNFFRNVSIIPLLHTDFTTINIKCDSDFTVEADIDTFNFYQWYRDSIPLSGENGSSLVVSPQLHPTSSYHLEVQLDGGCALLGPVPLEFPLDATCDSLWICDTEAIDRTGKLISQEGVYIDTFSNQYGCDSISELHLFVFPSSDIVFVEDSICSGDSYLLGGETFLMGGEYELTLVDKNGCDSSVVLVLQEKTTSVGDTIEAIIMEGEEFRFGETSYSQPGVFEDFNENKGFCGTTTIIALEVLSEEALIQNPVFIPNIFSPNRDGINDDFMVSFNPEIVKEINHISIYDKWGNRVYISNGNNSWNGQSKGGNVYSGVYVCAVEITYVTGTTDQVYGSVQIIK